MSDRETAPRAHGQVNGINVDRLESTIEAIKAAPALGRFTFRGANRWLTGGHNRTTVQGFWGAGAYNECDSFVIDSATPTLILGAHEAPNPFEYVLHALAGCITTTLVYHAALHFVRVHAVESVIEADLDLGGFLGLREHTGKGFRAIRARLRVKADCPEEKLRGFLRSAQKCSPVAEMMMAGVPLSVSFDAM